MKYNGAKKILTLCASFAVIALTCVLGACAIPAMNDTSGAQTAATVRISIGQNAADARTVQPSAPKFTKYVLSFTPNGGQTAIADKEITGPSTEISLAAGSWKITAKAYAAFNGADAVVAEGSTTITAESGKNISASITVSAITNGSNGKFDYTISTPKGIGAGYYELSYYAYGDSATKKEIIGSIDTSTAAFSKTGSIDLAPGYYVVTVAIEASASTSASKKEVVHIYPNMDSVASFAFTAADFMPEIQLSGTLTAKNNSTALSTNGWSMKAYTDKGETNSRVGSAYIDDDTGAWRIATAAFATKTPLYIMVEGKDASGNPFKQWLPDPIQAGSESISSIALTCDLSLITLSGTFSYKLNGSKQTLQYLSIQAKTNPNDYSSTVARASYYTSAETWSLTMPAFDSDTPVYLSVTAQDSSGSYVAKEFTTPYSVSSVSIPDIALEIAKCSIGGTLSATINGSNPDVTGWTIIAYSDPEMNSRVSSANVSSSDGSWSMEIDAPAGTTKMYFRVSNGDATPQVYEKISGAWDVTEKGRSDINLAVLKSLIKLSGTASVKVDGVTKDPSDYYVDACNGNTTIDSVRVKSDGTWEMNIAPLSASAQVSFALGYIGNTVGTVGPYEVYNKDVSGITVASDLMTLSGTLTAAIDGTTQSTNNWRIALYTDSTYTQKAGTGIITADGSWSLLAKTITNPATCYFMLQSGAGDYYKISAPNISAGNSKGIALTLNVTTATISGTVSGFTGATTVVAIHDRTNLSAAQASMVGQGAIDSGAWEITCDAADFANKSVYLIVMTLGSGSSYTYYITKTPIEIPATGISNLELKASDLEIWNP